MRPKILLVEDDRAMASLTLKILADHGMDADHIIDAERTLEYLKTYRPNLLLLDVNLPGMSGMELCELLRRDAVHGRIPILMLTVLGNTRSRVQGLQIGADDYLGKPFEAAELVARIQALLRRAEIQGDLTHVLSAHGIEVDLDRHEAKVRGRVVELRPKEYDLLVTFLQRPGRLLSFEFMSQQVWKLDQDVTRHTLNEHIKNLRKKLGPLSVCIETVTDAGYRLSPPPKPQE